MTPGVAACSLAELNLSAFYRTGESDLVKDFYVPALSLATKYDRSSGYFTAEALAILAEGLEAFIRSGGVMRLVVSPRMDPQTAAAAEMGYESRRLYEWTEARLLEILEEALQTQHAATTLVAAMVGAGRLDIKVALPTHAQREGIYHEKFGLIADEAGDWVAFTGSPNETAGGLIRNFESIAVFRRSSGEEERVRELRERFDRMWLGQTPGLTVIELPDAARQRLIQMAPRDLAALLAREPTPPVRLRDYQQRAIERWNEANRRGIWEMATGTGKTRAALEAVTPLIAEGLVVLVVVPGKDLIDQWSAVIERHFSDTIVVKCSSESPEWRKQADRALLQRHLEPKDRRPTFLVATAATASSADFSRLVSPVSPGSLVLVGDEVHRLGASSWRRVLDLHAGGGRLGLSATPERKWDHEGNAAISRFFGEKVYSYSLEQAQVDGWLCPYEYLIYPVGLEPDERAAYQELTAKISKLLMVLTGAYGLSADDLGKVLRRAQAEGNPQLEKLLFDRADLIKCAVGKQEVVRLIASRGDIDRCLIYCNEEPQVEQALSVLRAARRRAIGFTSSRLDGSDRSLILRDFGEGLYEFVVAIRCLDEGIDIPDCRHAVVLASSKTEREWIQRRGRVLRIAPGKDHAVIHDCIVVPSRLDEDGELLDRIAPAEVAILDGELVRAREFAGAALNMAEVTGQLEELRQRVRAAADTGRPSAASIILG